MSTVGQEQEKVGWVWVAHAVDESVDPEDDDGVPNTIGAYVTKELMLRRLQEIKPGKVGMEHTLVEGLESQQRAAQVAVLEFTKKRIERRIARLKKVRRTAKVLTDIPYTVAQGQIEELNKVCDLIDLQIEGLSIPTGAQMKERMYAGQCTWCGKQLSAKGRKKGHKVCDACVKKESAL